jgi:small subunit ribosomal protein S4
MVKRKRKKYSRPKKLFDKTRIQEENVLKEKYGLKNKKEIWKADAAIGRIRNLAKELITKSDEEKKAFVDRLQKKGFQVENLANALGLNKEDWLKRRLQTIVFKKKLALTPKQSRQLVGHKHVSINGSIVNIPSYMVSLEEEGKIKLNLSLKIPPKKKPEVKKVVAHEGVPPKEGKEKAPEVKEAVKEKPVEIIKETKVETPEKSELEKPMEVAA